MMPISFFFIYKGFRAPEHVTHVRIDKSLDGIADDAFEYCISLEYIETHYELDVLENMPFIAVIH